MNAIIRQNNLTFFVFFGKVPESHFMRHFLYNHKGETMTELISPINQQMLNQLHTLLSLLICAQDHARAMGILDVFVASAGRTSDLELAIIYTERYRVRSSDGQIAKASDELVTAIKHCFASIKNDPDSAVVVASLLSSITKSINEDRVPVNPSKIYEHACNYACIDFSTNNVYSLEVSFVVNLATARLFAACNIKDAALDFLLQAIKGVMRCEDPKELFSICAHLDTSDLEQFPTLGKECFSLIEDKNFVSTKSAKKVLLATFAESYLELRNLELAILFTDALSPLCNPDQYDPRAVIEAIRAVYHDRVMYDPQKAVCGISQFLATIPEQKIPSITFAIVFYWQTYYGSEQGWIPNYLLRISIQGTSLETWYKKGMVRLGMQLLD